MLILLIFFQMQPAHAEGLVEYEVYSHYTLTTQGEFLQRLRFTWAEFEQSSQHKIDLADANDPLSWKLFELLLPQADAESHVGFCPIGGGERELVRDAAGKMLCPTKGRSCGDFSDGGFKCFPLYGEACVARLPLKGLSGRCQRAAETSHTALTQEKFKALSEQVGTLIQHCKDKSYGPRFQSNCARFEERINTLAKLESTKAQEPSSDEQIKSPAPAPARYRASTKACFPRKAQSISYNPGGEVDEFVNKAKRLNREGVGLKITGPCISACVDMVSQLPTGSVCVGPRAELGFHYMTDEDSSYVSSQAKRDTDSFVSSQYPPALQKFWKRVKGIGDPLEVKYMKGPELRAVYRSCSELKTSDICSSDEAARESARRRVASKAPSFSNAPTEADRLSFGGDEAAADQ